MPGELLPGGRTFDFAENPWNNTSATSRLPAPTLPSPGHRLWRIPPSHAQSSAAESVLCEKRQHGKIRSIAHQGETPAPGGGTFRLAFGRLGSTTSARSCLPRSDQVARAGMSLGLFLKYRSTTSPSPNRPCHARRAGTCSAPVLPSSINTLTTT